MTRFRFLTITAILTALLAGGAALAQGPGPGGRRGPGGPGGRGGFGGPAAGLPIRELNLSDTQQQQIRDLAQQYREQNRAASQQLQAALETQRKAVATLPVDEGLIRSTSQALVEAQTERAVQQARLQSEMFALLTPAQQEQARKLQTEREARVAQRRQQVEQRRQQQPGQ